MIIKVNKTNDLTANDLTVITYAASTASKPVTLRLTDSQVQHLMGILQLSQNATTFQFELEIK